MESVRQASRGICLLQASNVAIQQEFLLGLGVRLAREISVR